MKDIIFELSKKYFINSTGVYIYISNCNKKDALDIEECYGDLTYIETKTLSTEELSIFQYQ